MLSSTQIPKRPLVLDGAIGSALQQQGLLEDKSAWMSASNLIFPNKVRNLHKAYIQAGADIITSNTFRTNPVALKNSSLSISISEFVELSVALAKEAIGSKNILLAGSNAPAEDCYQIPRTILPNELEFNHKIHIELLMENGCDFILSETQSHMDEIKIICEFCHSNNIPYVMSLYFTNELKLLSGEPLNKVIDFILKYSPAAIGFNCINPATFKKAIAHLKLNFSWGFYLNCGSGQHTDSNITCGIFPQEYIYDIQDGLALSPLFVGSCCGSNPDHTKLLKEHINEFHNSKSSRKD